MNEFGNITFPLFVLDSDGPWDSAWNHHNDFEIHRISTLNSSFESAFRSCIETAIEIDEDFVMLCDRTTYISSGYKKVSLIDNIITAYRHGADLLFGNIGNFECAVPITESLLWLNELTMSNCVVIFKKFYTSALELKEINSFDSLSAMIANKMVIYPFMVDYIINNHIAIEYPEVIKKMITDNYLQTNIKLSTYKKAFLRFK